MNRLETVTDFLRRCDFSQAQVRWVTTGANGGMVCHKNHRRAKNATWASPGRQIDMMLVVPIRPLPAPEGPETDEAPDAD